MPDIKIAPSILSADFGHLARDVAEAEAAGADWIHVDVMDGRFVPNLTIGPGVTGAVRRATRLPVDVHLMIEEPSALIPAFVDAGADRVTVHVEACPHLHRVVSQIRGLGARPGVALNPGTSLETVRGVLGFVDLLLVMTVNPGFGGQAFICTSPEKVRGAQAMVLESGRAGEIEIQVDGGVDPETAPLVVGAGATVLVAGSAVFGAPGGPAVTIPALSNASRG